MDSIAISFVALVLNLLGILAKSLIVKGLIVAQKSFGCLIHWLPKAFQSQLF